MQGERRGQVYLDYAEPQPKVHLYEAYRAVKVYKWVKVKVTL